MARFDCLASLMLKKMDLKCPLLSLVWQQKEIASFKLTAVIEKEQLEEKDIYIPCLSQ